MRLLAVLPNHVVSAALERAQLHDGQFLSAVQASYVGLVYNLAKRIQHTRPGVGAIRIYGPNRHPSETRS